MTATGATFVSGEGVRLDLRTAAIASRAIAGGIDFAAQFGMVFLLLLLDLAVIGDSDVDARRAVLIAELVLVLAGYPIVFEWLCRGRTLGKMAMGLRVVRDDGGPITFRHALVRGLSGLVLEKPGLFVPIGTFAGMATVAANDREKRIGDLMAGTLVLNERAVTRSVQLPPPWVVPELRPWILEADLRGIDDRLALALRQFVSRAWDMTPVAQLELGEQLRARVVAAVVPPPPPWVPTPVLLQSVLSERRRRSGEPVAGGPPGPFTAPPFGQSPPPFVPAPFVPAPFVPAPPPPAGGQSPWSREGAGEPPVGPAPRPEDPPAFTPPS